MRVESDDEVYRVRAVWLGPRGLTLPWTARYVAYAAWLATFLLVLVVESVVWHVPRIPTWEFCASVLLTGVIMRVVDHDVGLGVLGATARDEVRSTLWLLRVRRMIRRERRAVDTPVAYRLRTEGGGRVRRGKQVRGAHVNLPFDEVIENLTVGRNSVIAWYVLSPQRWSFRSNEQRESVLDLFAQRLAALADHRVTIRVTHRPYPVEHWARTLHRVTPTPLAVDDPGRTWRTHLIDTQRHLIDTTLSDKVVFLGVHLARRTPVDAVLNFVTRRTTDWELNRLRERRAQVTEIVAGPGTDGHEATTEEIEWLVHRSVGLGAYAAPRGSGVPGGNWTADDVGDFVDGVQVTSVGPLSDVLRMVVRRDEQVTTHHVAVLTLGRMGELGIPESGREPWMQHVERLPFPVEWCATFTVLRGTDAHRQVRRKLQVVRDMQHHYDEHDVDEPLVLERQVMQAKRVEDEMTQGVDVVAARAHGYVRLAVTGVTEEECRRHVRQVVDHYHSVQIDVAHPRGQRALVNEFIPNGPVRVRTHTRRLPVRFLAAALPSVTATVGDRRGPYVGYTSGTSRRAVFYDTHYQTEIREASGLTPVVGGLGAGKSVLLGLVAYEAVRRGISTTILDPSGPLARLTELPELSRYARHLDLMRAPAGTLNPYSVIRTPSRAQFDNDPDVLGLHPKFRAERADALFHDATQEARHDRQALALDVTRMLLQPEVVALPETALVLGDAIRGVGGWPTATLNQVIEQLDAHDDRYGKIVANHLRDVRDLPQARLFFALDGAHTYGYDEPTLLVLTMAGITPPPRDVARVNWSTAERLAVPLLHLAAHFTARRIYGLAMNERKFIGLDEIGQLAEWGSGRALITRIGRDTRKFNTCAFVASQSPSDILGLGSVIGNLISTAFVGRIEDEPTATEALRLLNVPVNSGYERVLGSLSSAGGGVVGSREFVMRDADGHVEKLRVDLTHRPELLRALNTTAATRERSNEDVLR